MLQLITERLTLRQYRAADLDALHSILSNSTTMSYWPAAFTIEQTKTWISRTETSWKEHGVGRCGIFLSETDVLIGDCGLSIAEIDGQQELDLGYIVDSEHWGKGYATEAAQAWLTFGLAISPRVVANMPVMHIASQRVAERLGMRIEKRFFNVRNRGIETLLYVATTD